MADAAKRIQKFRFRVFKAVVKGAVYFGLYLAVWLFLAPVSDMVPGFQQTVEIFVFVYVFFVVVGELLSGTVFVHFFNVGRELFVIGYLVLSLKDGVVGVTFENMRLVADFRLFLVIAVALSMLGLAKAMLQTINYMSEHP